MKKTILIITALILMNGCSSSPTVTEEPYRPTFYYVTFVSPDMAWGKGYAEDDYFKAVARARQSCELYSHTPETCTLYSAYDSDTVPDYWKLKEWSPQENPSKLSPEAMRKVYHRKRNKTYYNNSYSGTNCHWVRSYTRRDGTRVSGYRRCR